MVFGRDQPFVFCIKAYHPLQSGQGHLFSEYPVKVLEDAPGSLRVKTYGAAGPDCRLAVVGTDKSWKPKSAETVGDNEFRTTGGQVVSLKVDV